MHENTFCDISMHCLIYKQTFGATIAAAWIFYGNNRLFHNLVPGDGGVIRYLRHGDRCN